jgi:hypothetical protein
LTQSIERANNNRSLLVVNSDLIEHQKELSVYKRVEASRNSRHKILNKSRKGSI